MGTDRATVVQTVRDYLGQHRLDDVTIDVVDEAVRNDGGWWYVPVQPSERLPGVGRYYELLARVEEELDAKAGLNVLLVPTLPDR